MNCLVLDGSRKGERLLDRARGILEERLRAKGHAVETLALHALDVAPCKGCFACWVSTPGLCSTDDAGREIARKMVRSDLVVLLTPVTFGGYSSELKKALDRAICILLPFFTEVDGEVHHPMRYEWIPRFLALGVLPSADEESEGIFRALVGRNARNLEATGMTGEVLLDDRPEELATRLSRSLEGVLR